MPTVRNAAAAAGASRAASVRSDSDAEFLYFAVEGTAAYPQGAGGGGAVVAAFVESAQDKFFFGIIQIERIAADWNIFRSIGFIIGNI